MEKYCDKHKKKYWDLMICPLCDDEDHKVRAEAYAKLERPKVAGLEYKPLEEHTADSKWQYCNCQTCQEKRFKYEQMPGPKPDWDKIRLKDERY